MPGVSPMNCCAGCAPRPHQDLVTVLRDTTTYSSWLGGIGILDEPLPSRELMRQDWPAGRAQHRFQQLSTPHV